MLVKDIAKQLKNCFDDIYNFTYSLDDARSDVLSDKNQLEITLENIGNAITSVKEIYDPNN